MDRTRETEHPSTDAWKTLLAELAARRIGTPVVAFTGRFRTETGASSQTFGQATRLDDLVNLVIDVMEWQHFGSAFDTRTDFEAARVPVQR